MRWQCRKQKLQHISDGGNVSFVSIVQCKYLRYISNICRLLYMHEFLIMHAYMNHNARKLRELMDENSLQTFQFVASSRLTTAATEVGKKPNTCWYY